MPSPGETNLGGSFMMSGGGKGANQAVAASRLGGAVTHVLVNDPTRGYGIFAQTMLEQAEQVATAEK